MEKIKKKKKWEIATLIAMIALDASYHWADVLKVWEGYILYPHFPLFGIISYNLFWTTYWTVAFLIAVRLLIKIKKKGGENKMPISRKNFDTGNFDAKHTDRWNHPIAVLLRKNTGLAYRVDEIVKHVKLSEEGIRSMLTSFEEMGWIVHKQPYWAWKKGTKE